MRKFIWGIMVVALLWVGYWAIAAWGTRIGVERWVAIREAEGWDVSFDAQSGGGFPLAARQTLEGITLTRGDTQVIIPRAELKAALGQPGNASLTLPPQDLRIVLPGDTLTLVLKGAVADMKVRPNLTLELRNAALSARGFTVSSTEGLLAAVNGARLVMAQSADNSDTYNIRINVAGLTPAQNLRDVLRLPDDWPQSFNALTAQAIVAFDRPFDRTSKPGDRPQPRRIKLRDTNIAWGALNIAATADLAVDATGTPTGEAQITVREFDKALDVAQRAGLLPPAMRQQAGMLIGLIANNDAAPGSITIPIIFENGQMRAGIVPLGVAPRIYLQ